jgi:hypothetical protein
LAGGFAAFNIIPITLYVDPEDTMADVEPKAVAERVRRQAAILRAAEARGLLGSKDRHLGGRFSDTLVEAAKRASGITENTDLLTYALVKVALEDDFGERLLARKGRVPKGTFLAG